MQTAHIARFKWGKDAEQWAENRRRNGWRAYMQWDPLQEQWVVKSWLRPVSEPRLADMFGGE